ncbi:hypothetical protein [Crossiella cryophila]|uniref:Excreted virulence factor EspC (Type VII ESX diderm) n=1 Tax=Crossiella cryophila TaxID=43355 RepID=A0A7W7CCA4_9PSEU|nr:hypothetical protein [Crossiella cryophila]MBB4677223.1 hypothetical protein [Crossiella cryophila]
MGYGYSPEALKAAGKAAGKVGENASAIDLAGVTEMIGKALPGAISAGAATELGTAWRTSQRTWAGDAAEHGRKLADSHGAYNAAEDSAEGSLNRNRPR